MGDGTVECKMLKKSSIAGFKYRIHVSLFRLVVSNKETNTN